MKHAQNVPPLLLLLLLVGVLGGVGAEARPGAAQRQTARATAAEAGKSVASLDARLGAKGRRRMRPYRRNPRGGGGPCLLMAASGVGV